MDKTLNRLCAIVNLLKAAPEGLTVAEIAQTLQFNRARVRTDLELLSHELPLTVDCDAIGNEPGGESVTASERWFLLSKRNALPAVGFTTAEAVALTAVLKNVRSQPLQELRARIMAVLFDDPERTAMQRRQQRVLVKGARQAFESNRAEQAVALVEEAILSEHALKVSYRGPKETIVLALQPLGLIYYWVWGFWYLVALRDGDLRVYRVDRLESIEESSTFTYPEQFSLSEQFADSWGIEWDGPLVSITIQFYDEYRVVERVLRETAHRRHRQIEPINGGIIYHDRIRGLTEIRPWIRSFGSSAVVQEPCELRENMIQSAQWVYEKHC